MIIQCRKCDTLFRFDDTLIEGDGVWVRCSRCQHVFFQERSAAGESPSAVPPNGSEIPSVRISDARRVSGDSFSLTEERQPHAASGKTDVHPFLSAEVKQEVFPQFDKEPTIADIRADIEKEPLREPVADWRETPVEEESLEDEPARGGWGWLVLKIVALMVLIALIAGGISLWYFPEIRIMALKWASPWLRSVPGIEEKFLQTDTKNSESRQMPVGIKDVRQRSVANLLAGNLRVIEGTAVNQSSTPLARLRVRLVISDAFDAALGEKTAYCGNLLTDAELSTLAEVEIQRELSIPQGSDISNERILPTGEIPFMIVFSQEQAGAIKTVVTPAGADRIP